MLKLINLRSELRSSCATHMRSDGTCAFRVVVSTLLEGPTNRLVGSVR